MLYLLVKSSNKLNKLLVFICQPKILKMLKFTELKQKMVWNGSGCSSTSDCTPIIIRFDRLLHSSYRSVFRWRYFALPFYGESYHSLFPLSVPNSSVHIYSKNSWETFYKNSQDSTQIFSFTPQSGQKMKGVLGYTHIHFLLLVILYFLRHEETPYIILYVFPMLFQIYTVQLYSPVLWTLLEYTVPMRHQDAKKNFPWSNQKKTADLWDLNCTYANTWLDA
jgi:hypothetical protein